MDVPGHLQLLPEQLPDPWEPSVLALGQVDCPDEDEVLRLAAVSFPALTPCRLEACLLVREDRLVGRPGDPSDASGLAGLLTVPTGEAGPVALSGRPWAWAYPLSGPPGRVGYAVVSAAAEPAPECRVAIARLARQTGAALVRADLHRSEAECAARIRAVNVELAMVNDQLRHTVAELEQARETLTTLAAVAAAGAGERGIATALHAMTGYPVAVEDQFGNPLAWAGPDRPQPYPRQSPRRRVELLAEAGRRSVPLRDHDRLITPVQCRDRVLGLLALVDPERRAGRPESFALQHAAVVLGIELAHQRSLAETELRLRGDLIGDLLAGSHTESAISRAAALGHDLHGPHHVLAVRWPGAHDEDAVVLAVQRAVRLCDMDALVARQSDAVAVVTAPPESRGAAHRWGELHSALSEILPSTRGSIGVGEVHDWPAELPRSYSEALHALAMVEWSRGCGVMTFEELGVLRLLFTSQDKHGVEQFVRDWLGVLIDYDRARSTELVTTLSRYYGCGGNYDATAAALHVHRSTLRYRLQRIRDLTGHDLGAADCRLDLEIATQAWQVLRGSH
jgi:sugar diacid utilization regulator